MFAIKRTDSTPGNSVFPESELPARLAEAAPGASGDPGGRSPRVRTLDRPAAAAEGDWRFDWRNAAVNDERPGGEAGPFRDEDAELASFPDPLR